jgi:Carboxypeptidase regulatory-like domain
MRLRSAQLAGVLTLGLALVSGPLSACSCIAGSGQPCETYWGASTIFVGKVVEIVPLPRGADGYPWRSVRFEVLESLKGADAATAEVRTGRGGGDCGYEFKVGESYVVHANPGRSGELVTSICSATKPLSKGEADVTYARLVAHGGDRTGLFGRVVRVEREPGKEWAERVGLRGVEIAVEGPGGQRFSATTDDDGAFTIAGRLEGPYTVRALLPPGLPAKAAQEVVVPPGKCAGADFEVSFLASLSGRLIDADGKPVGSRWIELLPAAESRSGERGERRITASDGTFSFSDLPPGDYRLVVNRKGPAPYERPAYPSTWYPGAATAEGAAILSVRPSQTLELPDFQLLDQTGRP